jgi:hypothetical protein
MALNRMAALSLVSITALSLAACTDTHRSYRVASVGSAAAADYADGGSASGTGSGTGGSGSSGGSGSGAGTTGQSNLVVASGNILIGAASQYAQLTSSVNGSVPAGGVVNGKIGAILKTTGHTLVQLGTGTSVLLNGTGGKLGDLVTIDFGKGRVVGGPQPLVGVNVLAANPTTGSLATVSAASGNHLVGVTVLNPNTGNGSLVVAPQVAPLIGLQPVNGSLTGAVNGTVSATTTGLLSSN